VPQEIADVRVLITSPASATHDAGFSPFQYGDPDEILFVGFCKTLDLRADLLRRLREAATQAAGSSSVDSLELERQFEAEMAGGETAGALITAVRWWTQVKRKPYHAYSLKAGVGPYVTSFLVAFDEPDTLSMRFNLARAVDVLERERTRVMDFFGWEGSTEGF
jgi:hypothetical protein